MTEEVRVVAERLFARLTREDKESVVTIGIGKATTGKEILIAYCKPDRMIPVPEEFEGYQVLKTVSRVHGAR